MKLIFGSVLIFIVFTGAAYAATDACSCGETLRYAQLPSTRELLSSPGYPLTRCNVRCVWFLHSFVGYSVHVSISEFYANGLSLNVYDGLEFYSSPILSCSEGTCAEGTNATSTGPWMTIAAEAPTDVSQSLEFVAVWGAQLLNTGTLCCGERTRFLNSPYDHGVLTTPIRGPYLAVPLCFWQLNVFDGLLVELTLNTVGDDGSIDVLDGPASERPPQILSCAGASCSNMFAVSTGTSMTVRFTNDGNEFFATWKAIENSSANICKAIASIYENDGLTIDYCKKWDGKFYWKIARKMTWQDAEWNCNKIGGHLASIHSYVALNEVFGLDPKDFQKEFGCWIGLRRKNFNCSQPFIWSDVSSIDYFNWLPGQPDCTSGVEYCCHQDFGYGFNDYPCFAELCSFCSKLIA